MDHQLIISHLVDGGLLLVTCVISSLLIARAFISYGQELFSTGYSVGLLIALTYIHVFSYNLGVFLLRFTGVDDYYSVPIGIPLFACLMGLLTQMFCWDLKTTLKTKDLTATSSPKDSE